MSKDLSRHAQRRRMGDWIDDMGAAPIFRDRGLGGWLFFGDTPDPDEVCDKHGARWHTDEAGRDFVGHFIQESLV